MTGRIITGKNIIEVRQGDTFIINIHFRRQQQDIDLSGASIVMQIRQKDDGKLLQTVQASAVDASKGQFSLILAPELTVLDVGEYQTDIQLTTSDGSVNTFFPADVNKVGTLRITAQVTK